MPPKLTNEIILAAIDGFEVQKNRIDGQINELRSMLSGSPAELEAVAESPAGRRKFSAAARRRMKEAQQRRWAKVRGEAEPAATAPVAAAKPKRRLSEAGRKAIQEALRKRWALKHAEAGAAPSKRAVKKAAGKKAAGKKSAAKKTSAAKPESGTTT